MLCVFCLSACASAGAKAPNKQTLSVHGPHQKTQAITNNFLENLLQPGTDISKAISTLGKPSRIIDGFGNERVYLYPYKFKTGDDRVLSVVVNKDYRILKYMVINPIWYDDIFKRLNQ